MEDKTKNTLAKLKECYDLGKQYYADDQKRMRLLNQTDNGKLWAAVHAKFPAYQILPDTNYVSYVKDNILASLYTTAKSASILPTSEGDKALCVKLNLILDNYWDVNHVGFLQFQAGERAALLNLGITQIGWDENYLEGVVGTDNQKKGRIVLKNIDPMHFMRDPFADSFDNAGWCCTYERLHKSVLLADPKYSQEFKKYLNGKDNTGSMESIPNYHEASSSFDKDHYNLFKFWIQQDDGKINEYHTIDTDCLLYSKEDIKPSCYPFALLYCNLPGSGLIGTSAPSKIFANNLAYNLMTSLALTAEYKNQRPPKFVSRQSGLNINSFAQYGSEADRTFVVNNNAKDAVHYQEFPQMSPNINNVMAGLNADIHSVSGVDDRYTGRDTGSIITTGGTEEMLNRVTMIDTPKIVNYEKYTMDLTRLILKYMMEFAPAREYYVKLPNSNDYDTVEVDFPHINKNTLFEYSIAISSELPKNKQRIAAWADMIMEKQMQYRQQGQQVQLLTEEEWLMLQDIPGKEYFLERMGIQRDTNAVKEVSQSILQYAALLEQGLTPEEAVMQTAQTLQNTRMGMPIPQAEEQAMPTEAASMPGPTPPGMPM